MTRTRSYTLGDMHRKILRVLETYINQYGFAPSIREIAKQINCDSTSYVKYYLDQLKEMGVIERSDGKSRSIRLVKPLSSETHTNRLQLLGRIQAGQPIPVPGTADFSVFDEETASLEIPDWMLPKKREGLFALQVQGDSMIDAMISDGDLVVLRREPQLSNGMLVAAWIKSNEETTLKRYYMEEGRVRLQPANPSYDPIYVSPNDVDIQGQVILVIRRSEAIQ
jgi:repressor LexA